WRLGVNNASGGRPLEGPLAGLDQQGPAGLAAVAAVAGVALVGVAALVGYLVTYLTAATAERVGADLREAVFGVLVPEVLSLAGMVVVVLAVDLTLGLAALAVAPPLAAVVALRRRRIRTASGPPGDAEAALASEGTEAPR